MNIDSGTGDGDGGGDDDVPNNDTGRRAETEETEEDREVQRQNIR